MSDFDYLNQVLDNNTSQTLEKSLAMQIMKLFAITAMADKVISKREKQYVKAFLDKFFPENISQYLFNQFINYVTQDSDYKEIAQDINRNLSYQEKIFCIFKIYELIESDETEEIDIDVIRNMLEPYISSTDIAYIENIFGLRTVSQNILNQSSIISLQITSEISTSDVYMPYEGLELVVYKIFDIYCIVQKDNIHKAVVNNYKLNKGIFTRIPYNTDVKINDYTMKYHDFKIYFDNKVYPLQTDIYISRQNGELFFEYKKTENSVIKLSFRDLHIILNPLIRDVEVLLIDPSIDDHSYLDTGGNYLIDGHELNLKKHFLVPSQAYVNLNDKIYVDGARLELKDIIYYVNLEIEIPLEPSKQNFEITNDIKGDIYISDDMSEIWNAKIYRENSKFILHPGNCPYSIFLNQKSLGGPKRISHGDTIYVNNNFLDFNFENFNVKKTIFSFKKLIADVISYSYDNGFKALDDISFNINIGDLVCIMGPSGGGKSTLLGVLSGLYKPSKGSLLLEQHNFHKHFEVIKDHLGFVPQDDLLLANLTVYENLYYYAKLRFPQKSNKELATRIELILNDIGLSDKKYTKVGNPINKILSGGERKRLNIGLELLTNAEVYILDEPTSGLSSKDSEKIINLLANISNSGKIVITVVHQPGSKLFKMFNKVILLDKGGHLAFFGDTYSALKYFKGHMETQTTQGGTYDVECPLCKNVEPGLLLDSLEESLRDIDGTTLSERKYSPEYWKTKFINYLPNVRDSEIKHLSYSALPPQRVLSFSERLKQFYALFSRNLINKIRDRSNLMITFLEAPLLGVAIGFILRYSPDPDEGYSLYLNDNFRIFLFVTVIVIMFLALTNSIGEIIGDTALFLRERMLNMKNILYLSAKILVLAPFALLQNALFITPVFLILEVREPLLYLYYVIYLSILSLAGISLGLFVSSIPKISLKAAQNIVPLILIPQIILGGGLIQFKEMNQQMKFWKDDPIPEICKIMPSRWAYEGLLVLQETCNRYDSEVNRLNNAFTAFKKNNEKIISQYGKEYYDAEKERLEFELESFRNKYQSNYGNSDIHFLINGEDKIYRDKMMDADLNEGGYGGIFSTLYRKYPIFIRSKFIPVINKEVSTVFYNALVILFIALAFNLCTLYILDNRNRILSFKIKRSLKNIYKILPLKN